MEDEVSIEAKIVFVINSPISPKSKISNFCHFIRMIYQHNIIIII